MKLALLNSVVVPRWVLGGAPANAIRDRAGNYIQDRAANYIETRA